MEVFLLTKTGISGELEWLSAFSSMEAAVAALPPGVEPWSDTEWTQGIHDFTISRHTLDSEKVPHPAAHFPAYQPQP